MSIADVFDENDAEVAARSGGKLREGLRNLVPLNNRLTDRGTTKVKGAVVGRQNISGRTCKADVRRRRS